MLKADFQRQQYSELTQGNQGRDLLVGGLYIIVVCDLEKLKQLTIFSFPPLSLSLGCLSVCLGLFGCLEFLNIWEWNQAKWYTIFQCSNKISSITYENSSSCWLWISASLPSCLSSYNHPSVRRRGGGGNGGKRQCTCISWDPLSAHSTSTSSGIGSLILSELMAPFGVQVVFLTFHLKTTRFDRFVCLLVLVSIRPGYWAQHLWYQSVTVVPRLSMCEGLDHNMNN